MCGTRLAPGEKHWRILGQDCNKDVRILGQDVSIARPVGVSVGPVSAMVDGGLGLSVVGCARTKKSCACQTRHAKNLNLSFFLFFFEPYVYSLNISMNTSHHSFAF